jgi:uncharacterized protein YodC (DUF2158 family)
MIDVRDEFPEGSLVLLKSGGPMMTVELIRSDDLICTVWFAHNEPDVKRDAFSADQLVRIMK